MFNYEFIIQHSPKSYLGHLVGVDFRIILSCSIFISLCAVSTLNKAVSLNLIQRNFDLNKTKFNDKLPVFTI